MANKTYVVTRPWFGVKLDDEIELDPETMHPSLKAHVREKSRREAKLTPATPDAATGGASEGNNRRGNR